MDKENQEKTTNSQETQKETKNINKKTKKVENTDEVIKSTEETVNDNAGVKESCPACNEYKQDNQSNKMKDSISNENGETKAAEPKKRNVLIAVIVGIIVFIIFCLTTPFDKTEKTVCSPTKKSSIALTVRMESKDGKVIKFSQKETTKLKDYSMTAKEFKTAAKEIKKGTKAYDGLSYTYDVKDGVGIETLTLDTDTASTETYTLLGLTTKNGKDGKTVKVSTEKAIKSIENYGLKCK